MTPASDSGYSRRRALAALAAGSTLSVAGCIGTYGAGTTDIDLRVYNESPDEVTVMITFEREGQVAFEETYTLGSAHVERVNSILEAAAYEVTVEAEGQTERLAYDPAEENCNKWVSVSFNGDSDLVLTSDRC